MCRFANLTHSLPQKSTEAPCQLRWWLELQHNPIGIADYTTDRGVVDMEKRGPVRVVRENAAVAQAGDVVQGSGLFDVRRSRRRYSVLSKKS